MPLTFDGPMTRSPDDPMTRFEFKFVPFHIHARAAKRHAFHAQPESLFRAVLALQLDGSARAEHAMPRQSRNLPQYLHHLTRGAGPTRRAGDGSVARDHSRRQRANT